MVYLPLGAETAYHGVLSTAIMALIVEWILQNTRTMPGCLKVTFRDVRGGYRPTSKGCPLKLENALWKIRSRRCRVFLGLEPQNHSRIVSAFAHVGVFGVGELDLTAYRGGCRERQAHA